MERIAVKNRGRLAHSPGEDKIYPGPSQAFIRTKKNARSPVREAGVQ